MNAIRKDTRHNHRLGCRAEDCKPYRLADIAAESENRPWARQREKGDAIRDGQYHLTADWGPMIGWNRVEIRFSRKTGRKIPQFGDNSVVKEVVKSVGAKYNDEATLKLEITPGENAATFDVTS